MIYKVSVITMFIPGVIKDGHHQDRWKLSREDRVANSSDTHTTTFRFSISAEQNLGNGESEHFCCFSLLEA